MPPLFPPEHVRRAPEHVVGLAIFQCRADARFREHERGAGALHDEYLLLRDEATMSQQELVNVIAAGDAAINAENFDALMTF
jgi:hypothetical protein